jgi:hypothetical protein
VTAVLGCLFDTFTATPSIYVYGSHLLHPRLRVYHVAAINSTGALFVLTPQSIVLTMFVSPVLPLQSRYFSYRYIYGFHSLPE